MTKKKKNLVPQNGRINENSLLLFISLAQGINMNPTSQADDRRKDLTDQSCAYEEVTPAVSSPFMFVIFTNDYRKNLSHIYSSPVRKDKSELYV